MNIIEWRAKCTKADMLTDIAILRERLRGDGRNYKNDGYKQIDLICDSLKKFIETADPKPDNPSFEGIDVLAGFCLRLAVRDPLRFSDLFSELTAQRRIEKLDASLTSGIGFLSGFLPDIFDDGLFGFDDVRRVITFDDLCLPPRRMVDRLLSAFKDDLAALLEDTVEAIMTAYHADLTKLEKSHQAIIDAFVAKLDADMDAHTEAFDEILGDLKDSLASALEEARPVLEDALFDRVAGDISNGGDARAWILAAFYLDGEEGACQRLTEILGPIHLSSSI